MGFGNAEELPYVDGTDPIYRAAENGDALKLKRALAGIASKRDRWAAANVRNEDAGDKSPLHIAASRGYMLMATDLLDAGAELLPDEKGRTPLHLAAANGDKDMVMLLLKRTRTSSRRRRSSARVFEARGAGAPVQAAGHSQDAHLQGLRR